VAHSVRRHLRLDIDEYDASIRQFIPGYETMLEAAAARVAAISPTLVLDLGAGTGALSAALLSRPEIGCVALIEIDPEMMAKARARLDGFGDRARFRLASFDDPHPPCDAMAASLALHHIPTLEAKTALYGRAFEALAPGGVLVNADCTMPEDPEEQDAMYGLWIEHMGRHGIEEAEARRHFEDWSEEDHYQTLEDELAALRSVDFDAECVWRKGPMSVTVGRRSA
jgi:tRNA (cmo5U34)-methyltransferase